MAQINLLKQTRRVGSYWGIVPKILTKVFWVILILLILYYVWLVIDEKSSQNKIVAAQTKIRTALEEAPGSADRQELLTRQLQLRHLRELVEGHMYWSQLFPELARVTLKTANYKNLSVNSDGELSLNATVPSVEDLSKYIQVFDLPAFNENFSNIRISSFSKVQGKTASVIQFQVRMDYKPDLIHYNEKSN